MAKSKKRADKDNEADKTKGAEKDKGADKAKKSGGAAFKMMDKAAVMVTGILTPPITAAAWRMATGRKPPSETRHPHLSTREAVAWAVFAGVSAEVAKLLVQRETAQYWVRSTGELPPGIDD